MQRLFKYKIKMEGRPKVIITTFWTPLLLVMDLIFICNRLIKALLSIKSRDSSLFLVCVGL